MRSNFFKHVVARHREYYLGLVLISIAWLSGLVAFAPQSTYAALSAPLAAYSFDRMTGDNLFDESGNGNDCVVSDTINIFLAAGHTNSGILNQSTGRYADCTNRNLKPTSAITVMAWLKSDGIGGYLAVPASMSRNGTSDVWKLYAGNGGFDYAAELITTNGSAGAHSTFSANTTAWHHVAFTYDGSNIKLYVDGNLEVTQAHTGTLDYAGNTYPLKLFTDSSAEDYTQTIDDLRIFGTALSGGEIQQMMNTPVLNDNQNVYDRSVTMSTSKPSATGVTYSVSFKASEAYSLRTLILDFCSDSPLVGQTCTAPGGFTVGGSPTISNFAVNGSAPGGTWTGTSQNSGRTLTVAGSASTDISTNDIITFDVTTVTNPNTVTSFYGRILTYSFASPTYTATSTNNYKESGGVALATANGAGFTFQVPESLQFCVYKTVCGDTPALILGHGANDILDASQIDTDTAKFSIATNALSGVVVFARGSPPKINATTLAGINGGNGVVATMVAGTEAFGFRVSPTTGDIYGAGCYADNGGDDYCFDNAMVPPSTGAAIITGQTVPGPINSNELTMTFAATASNTTPAGVYQTAISLIASPTF